jgi:hypothetical protein
MAGNENYFVGNVRERVLVIVCHSFDNPDCPPAHSQLTFWVLMRNYIKKFGAVEKVLFNHKAHKVGTKYTKVKFYI